MSNENLIKMHSCGHTSCSPCNMEGYESKEIDFVCEYLDKIYGAGKLTGTFVDVGAHVGLWSLSLSDWYRHRYNIKPSIYALEPAALNYRQLLRNSKLDSESGIIPVQVAAWHTRETVFININQNPSRHSVNNTGVHARDRATVLGIKLDDVAKSPESKNIDVIKVDVEGAELNVMNGTREILTANDQLLVILEYSFEHLNSYGYKPNQLSNFMKAHDYRPARPEDDKVVASLRPGEIKRVMWIKGDTI